MKKNALTILAVTAALIMTSACGSKKKSGDGVNVGGNPDAGIAAKEMAFDAAGSDSGTIAGLSTIFFEYDQANITTTWPPMPSGSRTTPTWPCKSKGIAMPAAPWSTTSPWANAALWL